MNKAMGITENDQQYELSGCINALNVETSVFVKQCSSFLLSDILPRLSIKYRI